MQRRICRNGAALCELAHRSLTAKSAPATSDDETVQMLCRIGYVQEAVPATPRRPLAQFLQA